MHTSAEETVIQPIVAVLMPTLAIAASQYLGRTITSEELEKP
jgi:hypothetical protein